MREKPRSFIINKKSDYRRGCGGVFDDEKLVVDGCFISPLFDSGEKGARWYKLASLFRVPVNCSLKVTFFVFDERELVINDKKYDIEKLIAMPGAFEKKLRTFSASYKNVSHTMAEELLLTELKGRYLFFALQSVSSGGEFPEVYEMRLSFSPYMLTNLLPEIFRDEENSFLERYLAIYQSLYEDMEEKIDSAPESYTPDNPDNDFLKWLSDCFCIRTADLWNEKQLRIILANAPRLYKYIGTKAMIEEMCSLYLDCGVEIVEFYDKQEYHNKYGIAEDRLFIDPYVFTVIVQKSRLSAEQSDGLKKIVDACKPAYMSANIITLQNSDNKELRLGGDTILDDGIILS